MSGQARPQLPTRKRTRCLSRRTLSPPGPGNKEAATAARACLRGLLDGRAADVDEALLLVWELVLNGIQHTRSGGPGGTIDVMVTVGDRCRIEVRDAGPLNGQTPMLKPSQPGNRDETGRGLRLVDGFALDWGWASLAGGLVGTVVWFEVPAGT